MSNRQTDEYLESIQNRYEEAVSDKKWDLLSGIEREMEEAGFAHLVPALSQAMTDEDVREYKKWNKEMHEESDNTLHATDIVFNPKNL